MGINIILPLIMGIAMTVIIGSQVAPSYIEKIKIAKVENRTIANQEVIKDSIIRYIKTLGSLPTTLDDLKAQEILKDYHLDNTFNGSYTFVINKAKGTLTIFTTIDDPNAGKYFSNSFKFPNPPICVGNLVDGLCESKQFETFYLLSNEIFDKIKPPVGSIEDIENRFSEENLGKKYDPDSLVGGEDDFVVKGEEIKEYEYDKPTDKWNEKNTIIDGIGGNGSNGTIGVWIDNVEIDGKTYERITCEINPANYNKTILVVNPNTELGELIWIAPNSRTAIKTKIFGGTDATSLARSDFAFNPNNICMSNVTNISSLFSDATNFNSSIDRWDTSNVIDMRSMFDEARTFNQNINTWDTSKVTNMYRMFRNARVFNQPLNNWNTSKVTDMSGMFNDARVFNQPLNNWDTSNVVDIGVMFYSDDDTSTSFNQPIGNWNTSKVTSMKNMFRNASYFNQNLNNWDTSKVTHMGGVFSGSLSFNQPLNNWNTSNVTTMNSMFNRAFSFNQPIGNWNVSKVVDMQAMFNKAYSFNQPLNSWNVSNVTNMKWLFSQATLFNKPLNNWDTSNVTNMYATFQETAFNQDIGNWKTGNVVDMESMFSSTSSFNQDLSKWCVSKISIKPDGFDYSTTVWPKTLNVNGKIALQPQWGECP